MFRKPKRPVKATLRRQDSDDDQRGDASHSNEDDDEDDTDTSALLAEARKNNNSKKQKTTSRGTATTLDATSVLHTFASSSSASHTAAKPSEKDLAVSSAAHHSQSATAPAPAESAGFGADGIFRDSTRNKFYAGPIRASQNVRVTARFDYQPDICKDYKQTGFCGFGDTCIYLHDRGDTMSGWQLEQQWQQQQDAKKKLQEAELDAYLKGQEAGGGQKAGAILELEQDGLPFACHLCRNHFVEPVVTNCLHYFCQGCILRHVRETGEACPICNKDTFGVFNEPTKLMAKKRKILGAAKAKEEGSWKAFYDFFQGKSEEPK